MLLAVDVGNTNISLGLFDGHDLVADWRLATRPEQTSDEVGIQLNQLFRSKTLDPSSVDGVVVASVVPGFNAALLEALRRFIPVEPLVIGPGVKTGVKVRVDNPMEVGADRIANAVAAFQRFGGPTIVIDFGTAVTYDVISAEGDYLGGAIAPGIGISLDVLIKQTSQLVRVDPVAPESAIGRTTVTAIQSGLVWGFVAQVEGMVARIRAEMGGTARVVATGGQADMIAGLTSTIETVDPLLTLEGLHLIHLMNVTPP
ncbi:MAG TPA: type III pantothenate kinase [Candidatus Dormibacteraeota bacterium]|jgi:type III pantothenate kinase|nr:type III pantothenate kinase [Candidatus Dormibacteraeota bacterium]